MSEARMVDLGTAIEAQSGGGFSRLILFLCCAAMVIEGYDVQVLAYAAPAIIRDWNIERAYFGPVFGAALFGYMLGATLLTSVSDQIGRKKVIVLGNIFFGLLTVASAFAPNINVLLALRFLAGLGLGCSIPSAIALAVEYAPEQHRSFRVSILFIGYTLGAALGGMLTAALIVNFGWRSTFLFGGFASLTLAVVLFFILPESARFLAVMGGRDREIAAIMQRLLPHSRIDASTRFTLAEHKVEPGMPVKHLFTEGRAAVTSLLWAAFITSLMGHHFLTSWLPTVLNANGVPLAHAVVAGSLIQGGGARQSHRWPAAGSRRDDLHRDGVHHLDSLRGADRRGRHAGVPAHDDGVHLRDVPAGRADRPQRAGGHDLSDFRALLGRRVGVGRAWDQ
jgi:AAHS family 4-hydroxybenzoate transporter-like MFS transporter